MPAVYILQITPSSAAAGGRKEFCKTTGRETFKKRFAWLQIKTQSVVVFRLLQ